jgi:hypothetical protein
MKTMHSNGSKSKAMHRDILGFRYATNRWLALIGLSLVTLLLVLKQFSLLRTVVVRFYRRKKETKTHMISIHAYMKSTQTTSHTQAFE